jgi:hypothetical protein
LETASRIQFKSIIPPLNRQLMPTISSKRPGEDRISRSDKLAGREDEKKQ